MCLRGQELRTRQTLVPSISQLCNECVAPIRSPLPDPASTEESVGPRATEGCHRPGTTSGSLRKTLPSTPPPQSRPRGCGQPGLAETEKQFVSSGLTPALCWAQGGRRRKRRLQPSPGGMGGRLEKSKGFHPRSQQDRAGKAFPGLDRPGNGGPGEERAKPGHRAEPRGDSAQGEPSCGPREGSWGLTQRVNDPVSTGGTVQVGTPAPDLSSGECPYLPRVVPSPSPSI